VEPFVAPEPGLVQTEPPGAAVWLDGREVGRSPISVGELAPGAHSMRVELPGHAPTGFEFTVVAGTPPGPWSFSLYPLSAPLRVASEPLAALITVDGQRLGTAPVDAPLTPGRHEVRAEFKGYQPHVQYVDARPGEPVTITARLSPLPTPTPPADARAIAAALPPPMLPLPTPVPVYEGMFVNFAQLDQEPKHVSGAYPTRPEQAQKMRMTGTVVVEMVVTEAGHTTDLQVTRSATPVLDDAVLKALRQWRFEPAREKGVKVRTRLERTFTFR
jgi:TonB family protein